MRGRGACEFRLEYVRSGRSAYVASKHAVLALTESLREKMPDFIQVSLICPGFVRSELGPTELWALGLDTDHLVYTSIALLRAGALFVVSTPTTAVSRNETVKSCGLMKPMRHVTKAIVNSMCAA